MRFHCFAIVVATSWCWSLLELVLLLTWTCSCTKLTTIPTAIMLMDTDLKILQTRAKDSAVFPSKADSRLWREIQHGILTETPNGYRDAKKGHLGQGQWLQKVPQWEMWSVYSSFSQSLLLRSACSISTESCLWVGRGIADRQRTCLSP